ncbi:hypothetical protein DFQ28_001355 [Apophysomyces sp. BC1034]|nr:hypothetical protein DFQ30_001677 [Apophysomyces sp. BC1015]KAG0180362.1 hypothetical protein DFQ29_000840 [Apophysomyces sp. BC1021]KAG0190917.1 hypothetical protein DFQ28_001355 [Apophysomyces sp. BC1034]
MKTVIVKIGGAAITNKQGICQLTPDYALDALLTQVQHAHRAHSSLGHRLVLIHGAGSFAHPQAKQYRLKDGWTPAGLSNSPSEDMEDQKAGFAHTRKCLLQLHVTLLLRLQNLGLPVLSVSPFDYVEAHDGDKSPPSCFERMGQRVEQCLKLGFIPLLHGDTVFDRVLGCTVISGDVVMYQLTMKLPDVIRCVFVTDVDGIYDADPKVVANAKLIDHVQVTATEEEEPITTKRQTNSSDVADVTGGMQGKAKWAKRIILDSNRDDLHVVICKSGSAESVHAIALEPLFENGSLRSHQRMTVFTSIDIK